MICQFCRDLGEKSTLSQGTMAATCMALSPERWDEDGEPIGLRDPNWYTTEYRCSRGHFFTVTRREGSPDEIILMSTSSICVYPPGNPTANG